MSDFYKIDNFMVIILLNILNFLKIYPFMLGPSRVGEHFCFFAREETIKVVYFLSKKKVGQVYMYRLKEG